MDSTFTLQITELLFWVGFLLASPMFYILGKSITQKALNYFFPITKIEIRYTSCNGMKSSRVIDLKSKTPLVQQIKEQNC